MRCRILRKKYYHVHSSIRPQHNTMWQSVYTHTHTHFFWGSVLLSLTVNTHNGNQKQPCRWLRWLLCIFSSFDVYEKKIDRAFPLLHPAVMCIILDRKPWIWFISPTCFWNSYLISTVRYWQLASCLTACGLCCGLPGFILISSWAVLFSLSALLETVHINTIKTYGQMLFIVLLL